jgi:uncharacterized membrane protein
VVRAVLFYSPSCPHCHQVISEDLPPLFEKYGDRLQMIGVNTADAGGTTLLNAAVDKFNISPENLGVPLLVVADVVLVGSLDIPQQFPGLIEKYLAAGGVDWPEIPGLAAAIAQAEAAQPTSVTPPATPTAPDALLAPTLVPTSAPTAMRPTATPTPGLLTAGGISDESHARFDRDPIGNGLAVIVLAGMVAAFGWVIVQRPWRAWGQRAPVSRDWGNQPAGRPLDWAVPLLSIVGLGIASYLAYVETQQVQAVCGPVGDCNAVQQSEYARLFGLLPIGLLGVRGYLAILGAWAIYRLSSGQIGQWAGLALCVVTAGGVLFSIYLTFLEPFVIGATCAWCLSSAVIMTLLLLLSTARVFGAQNGVKHDKPEGERQTSWEG